ncbi:MAG: hypothetical protein ABMA13_22905 [Chthoniobacteraceae bacterium]
MKFPRALAEDVFLELCRLLDPAPALVFTEGAKAVHCPHARCERVCAVGGFRRAKSEMKDLELLYIPRIAKVVDAGDLFGAARETDLCEALWAELLSRGVLTKRVKENGAISAWGPENKHALHVPSGLPVDLFAATVDNWFNRLVVTTGSRESNIAIAAAARALRWEWEVNEAGFVPLGGTWEKCPRERRTMHSEREVFEFVQMKFKPPEERQ